MLPIGQFAKLANVSARTLRFYESLGLIESAGRGDNNYRIYDPRWLAQIARIRELQGLGFSLDEIKDILKVSHLEFIDNLTRKLKEVEHNMVILKERRESILKLLSVSKKIESGDFINDTERKEYMEAIQNEILSRLEDRNIPLSAEHLEYLKRDLDLQSPERLAYIEAIKKCIQFAQERNLKLGRVRGGLAASLVLHALGLNPTRPLIDSFYPERYSGNHDPDIHIDVEFERGQEFVDFCRDISQNLSYGQINAFKMPLIDIINNTQQRLNQPLDFDAIEDDSDLVLQPIRRGDIEKIFLFDVSQDALIMKYENRLSGFEDIQKMKDYVLSQEIHSFRDVQNILASYLPYSQERLEKIERYRQAKLKPHIYPGLDAKLQASLAPNFGLIIYHEEMIRIVAHYTGWDNKKANTFRKNYRSFMKEGDLHSAEFKEFVQLVPPAILELYLKENPVTFCQPHMRSFSYFTKATAVLKSMHPDIYEEEIQKWEQKNGFRWDDIGIKIKGVSLLQC